MSAFVICMTHFAIIHWKTSPTPVGLTVIRLQAISHSMETGSTCCVQSFRVSNAKASQNLTDDALNDLHVTILLTLTASTPDGPPEPFILSAASLTISPLILQKIVPGIAFIGSNKRTPSVASCVSGCFRL